MTSIANSNQSVDRRLESIAIALSDASFDPAKAAEVCRELAMEVNEIAVELQSYDLQEREGEFPTPRQALSLRRVLSQVMRDEQHGRDPGSARATVNRGGFGCGPNYLTFQLGDNFCGGIDREGRVST